jgi:hypothetical protein
MRHSPTAVSLNLVRRRSQPYCRTTFVEKGHLGRPLPGRRRHPHPDRARGPRPSTAESTPTGIVIGLGLGVVFAATLARPRVPAGPTRRQRPARSARLARISPMPSDQATAPGHMVLLANRRASLKARQDLFRVVLRNQTSLDAASDREPVLDQRQDQDVPGWASTDQHQAGRIPHRSVRVGRAPLEHLRSTLDE